MIVLVVVLNGFFLNKKKHIITIQQRTYRKLDFSQNRNFRMKGKKRFFRDFEQFKQFNKQNN